MSKNYWERLEIMKLSSIQRRHERYRIVYLWKILERMVPNYGIVWTWSERGGRKLQIPKSTYVHSAAARNMRDQSLIVHGGRIFNLLPRHIRDYTGTKETFKKILDEFLKEIPDQPLCEGLSPEAVNRITSKNSNSLYDWFLHLKISDRKITSDMTNTDSSSDNSDSDN